MKKFKFSLLLLYLLFNLFHLYGKEKSPYFNIQTTNNLQLLGTYKTPGQAIKVFVVGNRAFVADGSKGLRVIDVSIPSAPVEIASYEVADNNVKDIFVSGDYAFINMENTLHYTEYLKILDISNLSNIREQAALSASGSYINGISVSGNKACVAEGNSGLRVSDFQNLPYLNEIGNCYLSGSTYQGDIHVQGTTAFVSTGSYLEIYNVSDPTTPIFLNKVTTKSYAHHVFVQGNFAYLADVNGGLRIIDISNPALPVEVGSYIDTQTCTKGVYVSGNYAFLAEHFDGLVILDISSPSTPVKIGECDTAIHARNVYVQGNYAYVAAEETGLRIINISNLTSPYETGYYDPTSDVNDVYVKNNYAFLTQSDGLRVVNISNPSSPSETSFVSLTEPQGLCVNGDYTYVAGSYDGLRVYDTSNPASINEVGFYKPTFFQQSTDVFIKDDKAFVVGCDYGAGLSIIDVSNPTVPDNSILDTPGSANGVDIKDNYAFVADSSSMRVINIQNVLAPVNISNFPSLGSATDIVTSDKYAYLANEGHGIQIINIENPASLYQVSQITSSLLDYIYITDIYVKNNYLYVAEYDEIIVLNTSVPTNPSIVASYWPLNNLTGIYVLGNYIYCAEEYKGLMIFNNPFSQDSPPDIQITNPQDSQIISGIMNVTTNVNDDHGILKVDFFMDSTYAITDNSPPYSWTFNCLDYTVGSHQIKATAYDTASQVTEAVVNITIGTPSNSVKVTVPNVGLSWAVGSTQNIKWTTTGSVGKLKVEYSIDSGSSWILLDNSTTNDGIRPWKIPNTPSINCKIRLTSVGNPSISDISDHDFVIYESSIPASIRVISPNGGETWSVGTKQWIKWTTSGLPGHVKVEYTTNGGASWAPVENDTYNDGIRGWDIPNQPSDNCKIKISSVNNSNIYDMSDSLFTIGSVGVPSLLLDKTELNYGGTTGGLVTPPQTIFITKEGYGSVSWDANWSDSWISCSPASGYDSGELAISVNTSGLSVGNYSGVIVIQAPFTTNSEQNITVNFTVHSHGHTSSPFGYIETPANNSTVRSSIPVTGWVLDDIGIENIKICWQIGCSPGYSDNAILVEGARPDVEQAYPNYPMNYKAGWGYMLLTNFLPNGDGQYTLTAVAKDVEGHEVILGSKTIIVDNAHAVKPFGAIDTPAQGGQASGSNFVNWGWVLTPQPNSIPIDGSTINVWVDGVNIGHPNYNLYRVDVATKFPDYANTNGAIGYFYLDTTAYDNGIHTIQWTATDTGGNTDGIGSRYFTIQNTGADARASAAMGNRQLAIGELLRIDIDSTQPVLIQKGYSNDSFYEVSEVDDKAECRIRIRELEPLKIKASDGSSIIGCFQMVGNKIKKMPVGMSIRNNLINWMPGVGYLGNYRFVVIFKDKNGDLSKKYFNVTIEPKFYPRTDKRSIFIMN